jgi:hypothetical protein
VGGRRVVRRRRRTTTTRGDFDACVKKREAQKRRAAESEDARLSWRAGGGTEVAVFTIGTFVRGRNRGRKGADLYLLPVVSK